MPKPEQALSVPFRTAGSGLKAILPTQQQVSRVTRARKHSYRDCWSLSASLAPPFVICSLSVGDCCALGAL